MMRSVTAQLGGSLLAAVTTLALTLPARPAAAVDTDMAISTTSVDFGAIDPGGTATGSVTLTNTGGDPFGPINIFGGSPPSAEFGASQNCQAKTLPPGGSCSIGYTFTPGGTGPFSDSSNFTISETSSQSDGEDFSVALTGRGRPVFVAPTVGPLVTVVINPGSPDDSGAPLPPNPTTTTTTTDPATTTSTTPTNTTTATTPSSAGTVAPTGGTLPPSPGTGPPGAVVIVPGPLSDGGDAQVIAQGIVAFPDGSFRWDHQLLDLSAAAFTYEPGPPTLLASDGPAPLLNRTGNGSAALLDAGEAVFAPAGASGDLAQLVPGGTATAHRIVVVAGTEPISFVPGPGSRDVNLIRGVLDPGDVLHVVSPFPVLVIVVDGVVHDAPEGTELGAGSVRTLNDADLSNVDAAPATVLIAALGGAVP